MLLVYLMISEEEEQGFIVRTTGRYAWAYGKGHMGRTRTPLAIGLKMVSD